MTHTIEATAWTLIHFCWQAAVIAGVFRIVSAAFARRASQTRYVWHCQRFWPCWPRRCSPLRGRCGRPRLSGAIRTRVTQCQVSGDFPRMVAPGVTAPSRPAADNLARSLRSLPSVMGWIDAFWLIGVLAPGSARLWGMVGHPSPSYHSYYAASRPPFEPASNAFARTLGLARPVLLRVSSAIAGPVTMGALRAIVLVPVSAVTLLGPDELEVVLAHELAHVRRADFLWNLVQTLIETLFFFHPAVWWISGRVRHERELCCDDLALKICPNPVVYASALFHLEEQRSRQMSLAMALDGHQSAQTLRMRIARILGETMPAQSQSSRFVLFRRSAWRRSRRASAARAAGDRRAASPCSETENRRCSSGARRTPSAPRDFSARGSHPGFARSCSCSRFGSRACSCSRTCTENCRRASTDCPGADPD